MMQAFHDQTAVVTGASRGIGRAIALGLAAGGARVWLVARTEQALMAVAAEAGEAASRMRIAAVDLTHDEEVREFAALVQAKASRMDMLVHCAGMIVHGRLEDTATEQLDALYKANVRAPYLLTQLLLPSLRASRGQVVFINSSIVQNVTAGVGPFAATQRALEAIADALREEVNVDGIRVLSVFAGRTATPRQERLFNLEGKPFRPELLLQPEDIAATVNGALALPRTAEVTRIHLRPLIKSY